MLAASPIIAKHFAQISGGLFYVLLLVLQRELKNFFSIVFKRLLDNLKASDEYDDDGQSSNSDVKMHPASSKNPIVNQGYFNRIECKNNKGPCNSVCKSISKTLLATSNNSYLTSPLLNNKIYKLRMPKVNKKS